MVSQIPLRSYVRHLCSLALALIVKLRSIFKGVILMLYWKLRELALAPSHKKYLELESGLAQA